MVRKDPFFTVMISRGAGRVRVFRLSLLFIVCISLVLVLCITGSLVLLDLYLDEIQRKKEEIEELQALKQESREMRQTLHRSREHLKLLKEYVNNREVKTYEGVPLSEYQDQQEPSSKEEGGGVQGEALVDIEDMEVLKKGDILQVDFKLINVSEKKGEVEGYVHVLPLYERAGDISNRDPGRAAFPAGLPINYKEGRRFVIKRFKPVRDRLAFQPEKGPPSWLLLVVFNNEGDTILKRSFAVGDLS